MSYRRPTPLGAELELWPTPLGVPATPSLPPPRCATTAVSPPQPSGVHKAAGRDESVRTAFDSCDLGMNVAWP